jgi:hypothetical protein
MCRRNFLQQPRFVSPMTRLGAAEGTTVLCSNAALTNDAGCDVGSAALFSAQNADGQTLLLAQMAVRVLVVIEERLRRRRRRRRSSCCSCTGGILSYALLCRRAADAACLVACELGDSLPFAAARTQALCARMRAQTHAKAALCERVSSSGASAVVVQWSICLLTLVEADMLSGADREPLTSLHHAPQQQRMSAHCKLHAMY